jgi:arylsulfatase
MHSEWFSIRSGTHSVPIGEGLDGLTRWELTIAELLSGAGYRTGHFGKWHLGSSDGRLPNDQGFDEWYGIPRTTDEAFWPSEPAAKAAGVAYTHIMEGRKGEKSRELEVYDLDQRRLIDAEITRRTIDFMTRSVRAGKPFYAYVPFTLVHFPTLPNPKFVGKTGFGEFPDALAEMDAHVGEILDAVDALGIRENTIVVFTSDNGPESSWPWQGSSGPWRGLLYTHGGLVADAVHYPLAWPDSRRPPEQRDRPRGRHVQHFRQDCRRGGAERSGDRWDGPNRLPARQVGEGDPRGFSGLRGGPARGSQVAELQDRIL